MTDPIIVPEIAPIAELQKSMLAMLNAVEVTRAYVAVAHSQLEVARVETDRAINRLSLVNAQEHEREELKRHLADSLASSAASRGAHSKLQAEKDKALNERDDARDQLAAERAVLVELRRSLAATPPSCPPNGEAPPDELTSIKEALGNPQWALGEITSLLYERLNHAGVEVQNKAVAAILPYIPDAPLYERIEKLVVMHNLFLAERKALRAVIVVLKQEHSDAILAKDAAVYAERAAVEAERAERAEIAARIDPSKKLVAVL